VNLPQYTRNDKWIFLGAMPLIVMALNLLLFGSRYFTEWRVFLTGSVITFLVISCCWIFLTWVAITIRDRFSDDANIRVRMAVTLFFITLITALTLTILFYGYTRFSFLKYEVNETKYRWVLVFGLIINFFVTLFHEGSSGFEKWKATLVETEELKRVYMQSRLMGLKSQVNPHFLFNSLNSLSSLISEDRDKAEKFLDEMSKVYRYLLRNSDDELVSLETEISFINSYYHLLKVRYGQAIQLKINVSSEALHYSIPPLTLQVLFESAFTQNRMNQKEPLLVEISTPTPDSLSFKHNTQPKLLSIGEPREEGIENITNKFRLLGQQSVQIEEADSMRTITLPLILQPENSKT
jgi:hypothetical protein